MANTQAVLVPALLVYSLLAAVSAPSFGQPAGPILQIQGGGPAGHITSVCFSPDGEALYAGGWDKAVWVWRKTGNEFHLDESATFRFRIGPGLEGAINSIALSGDGQWLAVAGKGVFRGAAGYRGRGRMVPYSAMDPPMRLDQGTIHVVHTRTRESFQLRGHQGEVVGMAFTPGKGPPMLASAAREWNTQSATHVGAVRLWDIKSRQQVARMPDLPVPDGPPGIALQRIGPQVDQVSVSMAWWAQGAGSGLRFWNPSVAPSRVMSQADYSRSLLSLSDGRRLTASFWRMRPQQALQSTLRFWRPGRSGMIEEEGRRVDLLADGSNSVPTSLGVVRRNLLAITELGLVGKSLQAEEARLRLVDLGGSRPGKTVRTVKLWNASDPPRLPIMVASPNGDFVAVAGSPQGGVMLYQTDALLQDRQPGRELRFPAAKFEDVSFVAKDGQLGLRLLRDGVSDGDWTAGVFNFDTRSLELEALDDWQNASSNLARDLVRPGTPPSSANPRQTIRVGDENNSLTLRLPPQNTLTAAARADVANDPIWAIASARAGQPQLQLYDGHTGYPMRELSGHSQRIRTLSFSRDGQWLASIEDGPQVCVWSLADLNDARDDGGLPDVAVVKSQRPQTLKVIDSGGVDGLQTGDLLLGYLDGGIVRRWQTARDFDNTWWETRPGDQLTLRVERDEQVSDVLVTSEPGMDERKPLFSLLFAPNPANPTRASWLAWSPLGAFDSSDRQVENLVGWHFNGTGEAPPVYAALHRYRHEYYRPHLVRELIKTLEIPPRPRPGAPDLSLWIPDSEVDISGQANRLVRDREVTAVLNLDPTFPLDLVDSVSLRWDGQPSGEFQLQADRTWQANLPPLSTSGEVHRARVVVKSNESPARRFQAELSYRFNPEATLQPDPAVPVATVLPLRKRAETAADGRVSVEFELDRPLAKDEMLTLSVNDREVETPIEISNVPGHNARGTALIAIDLAQENKIQARTRGSAQSVVSEPLIVPSATPSVKSIQRDPLADNAFESLAVEVEGASPSSRVFFGERELSGSDFQFADLGNGLGQITINQIAPGKKVFALRIDHGSPIEVPSSTDAISASRQQLSAPEVHLGGSATVFLSDTNRYTLEFEVRSPTHIDRIDVYNGTLVHRDARVEARQDAQGFYLVNKTVELDVEPGLSKIDILARNQHGEGSASIGVTRLFYPVSAVVDGFSLDGMESVSVKPVLGSNGRLTFQEPLPTGAVTLHGHVHWEDLNDPQLQANRSTVRIWVNGFQQLPASLDPVENGGQDRHFTATVVLNQDRANLIELEVSSAEVASNPRRFYVDCREPVKHRRMHLLVVSVDQADKDPQALIGSAIDAFDGWRTDSDDQDPQQAAFATPVFESGYVYGPLTARDLDRELLHATILEITQQIRLLNVRNKPATDVILIYYRGAELINKPEGFYLTTSPADEKDPELARIIRDPINLEQFAISSEFLNRIVETSPGAYVLLLDVARAANAAGGQAEWPNDSHAALLRYAWLAGLRVPEAARLLAGLRVTLPEAYSLGEVYEKLRDNHMQLQEQFPRSVSFLGYLPANLEGITMGGLTPVNP